MPVVPKNAGTGALRDLLIEWMIVAEPSPEPEPEALPEPVPSSSGASMDWERFYANYRNPGYIPGYEIGHRLGGGVFGIVYKARKESIGKPYAIKFLKVEDASIREQVLRELETVKLFAQVDHPNLVSIEDQGVVDSVPYIIMGYAGEETLKDRLVDGRLDEEVALQVFVQVLRGVGALHEHSLIHFDLKPANIFLKGDVARVGDYGLSKLVTESCMSLSMGRGTPYYMAPEMLHRRGDHRSDIYSLGVILFECLSGEVPFGGESEWEVLRGHEEGELVFPETVPPRLRPILAHMLEKNPEDRFQSLADVLGALRTPQSFKRPAPVAAPRSLAGERSVREAVIRDRPRRRPGLLIAMFIVGSVLLSMLGVRYRGGSSWAIMGVFFAVMIPVLAFGGRHSRGNRAAPHWRRSARLSWVLVAGLMLLLLFILGVYYSARMPH